MSQSLISALRSGRFFDHSEDLQVHETPASWVVLAGEHAYKIRKPVDNDAFEASGPARRRRACEREVRRRRRFAEDLDCRVVPITATPEAPVIDGESEAFEYAICMRRIDDRQLFSNLNARGELTSSLIDNLVDQLVELHRGAARAAPDVEYGACVRAMGRQQLDRLRPFLDQREDIRRLEELSLQSEELGERLAPLFDRRLAEGRVVEVHGGPDLDHVAADGVRAVVFGEGADESCEFRDACDDLTALLMDLEARQAHAEARQALNRYLERSGDYALVTLLPWYRIQRAMAAAESALREASSESVERDAALRAFRHYAGLAERYGEINIPWLLIGVGVTGSGKSRFTEQVVRSLGALRIRSDVERKRFYGLAVDDAPPSHPEAAFYGEKSTQATYERLATLAGKLLSSGYPVCVDATSLGRAQRDRLRLEAQKRGLAALLISFEADEKTLEARVSRRSLKRNSTPEAGLAVLKRQIAAREAFDADELAWMIRLDTTAEGANLKLVSLIRERLRLH